jgi:hypothetical protein
MSRPIADPEVWADSNEVAASNRLWATIMLARHVDTCAAICRGDRVRVGNLDKFVLRRGLRGVEPSDPESYLLVTAEMLDAVAEAGPITSEEAQ